MTSVPFVRVDRDKVSWVKRRLVEKVEHTAEWRTLKAEEYPDAKRNLRASEDLSALADSLRGIGDDDPLWLAYACAVANADDAMRLSERGSEELRLIGFWRSAPDGREFLRELLHVTEQEALL